MQLVFLFHKISDAFNWMLHIGCIVALNTFRSKLRFWSQFHTSFELNLKVFSLFTLECSQIRRVNHLATISLNLLLTLCASNLVFIVGVQTSKNVFKCEMIAVLLHYFHLSTAVWGLCHSFSIYDYVINENVPVIKYNNLLAFGASAVFVLVSECSFF